MKICFFLFILHVKIHVIAILTKNTLKKKYHFKTTNKIIFSSLYFQTTTMKVTAKPNLA